MCDLTSFSQFVVNLKYLKFCLVRIKMILEKHLVQIHYVLFKVSWIMFNSALEVLNIFYMTFELQETFELQVPTPKYSY